MSRREIEDDLLATCAGLGYTEGDLYYKGEECWGKAEKDLILTVDFDSPHLICLS